MTVAGPVFLGIIGMSIYLYSKTAGKHIFLPKVNVIIPYLWVVGTLIFSTGLSWGGLIGEPRRTNLGLTFLNPASEMYTPEWVPTTMLALFGGIIMTIAAILFFVVFFGTIFSKRREEPVLELPVSEILHDEKRIPLFDTFKPWLVAMGVILALAYIPAFMDASKNPGPGAPPFLPNDPTPIENKKSSSNIVAPESAVTLAKGK
jgi:cytochrome c oxidase subunit 1